MLRYKRPHDSVTEEEWIAKFLYPTGAELDGFGNVILTIGDKPTTMFSAHTDTVHRAAGMQEVLVNDQNIASIAKEPIPKFNPQPKKGKKIELTMANNCLGADDTTGCWLLLNLIHAGVPGLYVFHRGEERGGLGSSWLAENTPELLIGIERCIAFDRLGYTDVITHQSMSRCCSDTFAKALSAELGRVDGHEPYAPDDTGSFTDSANYTDLIGECTNVAVGYFFQHTANEVQDLTFAHELAKRLVQIDWESLPTERMPGEDEWLDYGGSWGRQSYAFEDYSTPAATNYTSQGYSVQRYRTVPEGFDGKRMMTREDWEQALNQDEEWVLDVLMSCELTFDHAEVMSPYSPPWSERRSAAQAPNPNADPDELESVFPGDEARLIQEELKHL